MTFFILKIFISATIIALASEISKRSGFWGALLISLPTMSILSMIWIYIETKDVEKIASISWDILWLVLPTLPFFIVIPVMLRKGISFPVTMISACLITMVFYFGTVKLMPK